MCVFPSFENVSSLSLCDDIVKYFSFLLVFPIVPGKSLSLGQTLSSVKICSLLGNFTRVSLSGGY